MLRKGGLDSLKAAQVPVVEAREPPDPRSILTSIGGVVYDWDIGADTLVWGANVADVLCAEAGNAASGAAYAEQVAADSRTNRHDAIFNSRLRDEGQGVPYHLVYALRGEGGANLPVADSGRWFAAADGRPARAHGILRRLGAQAHAGDDAIDALTGLPARVALMARLAEHCDLAARNQSSFGVVLASIGNLGAINRQHGYDAADEMLAAFAARLRGHLRSSDFIARLAGNKFAVILDLCDSEQMAVAAARLFDAVAATPVQTCAGPVAVSMRVGGVVGPRQARGGQALLQRAEEALDIAREGAARRFVAYAPSLVRDEARQRALAASDEIVSALNERRILLAYQPIVDAKTHKLVFNEALMRIRTPDGEIVSGASMLPEAEKIGLAQLLDQRVLELALERLTRHRHESLSVNMSAASAYDADWQALLAGTLRRDAEVASRLVIEITETAAIVDIDATRQLFGAMKKLGVRVAMDDFGAGHTSFRNLRELGVDLLKIDGAFVQNLSSSADDRFFVRTLVNLANHLGIETVAEWVEDAESARLLVEWGVTYLQGFHFGKAEIPQRDAEEAAA